MLEALHTYTWFSLELIDGVIRTKKGVLADNALGDLIFSLAMSKALRIARDRLRKAGLTYEFSIHQQLHLLPPDLAEAAWNAREAHETSYDDDMMYPVYAPASMISQRVADTVAIIQIVFAAFGVIFNYKPGKSAAVVTFRGPGRAKAQAAVFASSPPGIMVTDLSGTPVRLTLSHRYVHLGTAYTLGHSLLLAIRHRSGQALASHGLLAHNIKSVQAANPGRACIVVASLHTSSAAFQVSTYPSYTEALIRSRGRLLAIQRRLHREGLPMARQRAVLRLWHIALKGARSRYTVDELFIPLAMDIAVQPHILDLAIRQTARARQVSLRNDLNHIFDRRANAIDAALLEGDYTTIYRQLRPVLKPRGAPIGHPLLDKTHTLVYEPV